LRDNAVIKNEITLCIKQDIRYNDRREKLKMRALFLSALLLLSACGTVNDLQELRARKPDTSTFGSALASEYLAYAESREEEGHPIRAGRFAKKGLRALENGDVPPDEDPKFLEERHALLAVLTPDVKEVSPAKAARAQLMYDCWVDGDGVCKRSYGQALADLQPIADALVHGDDNRFAVHFDKGSAALSATASAVLDVVAKRTEGMGRYQVELTVPSKKNSLNTRRLLAVEQGLIVRGVNAGHIDVHGSRKNKEVVLSSDKKAQSTVTIHIQTFGAPTEGVVP